MTLSDTIRKINLLKEHAKECIEQEAGEMGVAAVNAEDVEALAMAATALEALRIMGGIFDKERQAGS